MITMGNWATQAVAKLEKEKTAVSGRREKIMVGDIVNTLKEFCLQDEEFAQAVVQGGALSECMAAVAKGVGDHIKDLAAYTRAVQFFFPGANIDMRMRIDLVGDAAQDDCDNYSGDSIILNLMDIL